MSLSTNAIESLADVLAEDFSMFLQEMYFDEISEVLSTASCDFLQRELGDVDGDLGADLQMALLERVRVG